MFAAMLKSDLTVTHCSADCDDITCEASYWRMRIEKNHVVLDGIAIFHLPNIIKELVTLKFFSQLLDAHVRLKV